MKKITILIVAVLAVAVYAAETVNPTAEVQAVQMLSKGKAKVYVEFLRGDKVIHKTKYVVGSKTELEAAMKKDLANVYKYLKSTEAQIKAGDKVELTAEEKAVLDKELKPKTAKIDDSTKTDTGKAGD